MLSWSNLLPNYSTNKNHGKPQKFSNRRLDEDRTLRSKMVTGTQMQTAWALGIRDLAETLETNMAEIKHQGELKLWHPEPLACGSLLHVTIHWKNRLATTCPPAHWPLPHRLTSSTGHRLVTAHLPASQHTSRCPTKPPGHHSVGPPGCLPPSYPLANRPPPATEGIQHYQTPASNPTRRCRKTGLDAKRVTPELRRLKFYCSWIRDFFSLSVCFSCSLFDCPPPLPVDFFGSAFFSFSFSFSSFFSFFLGFVNFTIVS
jgi:hypothetical protein